MAEAKKRGIPKPLIALILLLAAGGFLAWRYLGEPETATNLVTLSGRIEGDESSIASKTSGRIREIRFREGDPVNAGDVIAILVS